jgi:predicted dehydrogenase
VIRLALVGFGKWGRNYVGAAKDAGNCEVTHVVKQSNIIRREDEQYVDGRRFHCGINGIHDALPYVDAVVISSHPSNHAVLSEIALHKCKPVMVEKPAGLSISDAERLLSAEQTAKVPVLVAHQHLFSVGYERVRAMGMPCHVEAEWYGPGPVRDYSALWDYGPHAVSAALGLVGDCTVISAMTMSKRRFDISLQHAHGTAHLFVSSSSAEKGAHITAHAGDGYSATYDAYEHNQAEPPLTRAVRAFAAAVEAGGTDDYRFGARWAVNVARVLEASDRLISQ